jgi:ribosome-associated protein
MQIVGVEAAGDSGWTVMDAFDVMVHIFTAETRARYRLEHLWRDGDDVAAKDLLEEKKRPARKKKKAVKKPLAKSKPRRK